MDASAGSTSRGTARSTNSTGRPRRERNAETSRSPVEDEPRRARRRDDDVRLASAASATSPSGSARAPSSAASRSACSSVRLTTTVTVAPRERRFRAVSSLSPARSDQHDAAAVEALEDLLREGGRRGRDGGWALADRRLETRATAGVQRHAEGPVEQRAGGSHLEGVPHLAEDLALAGDERVEARCDAEQVQRGRRRPKPVCDRSERVRVRSREREERAIARSRPRRRRATRCRAPCGCRSRARPPRSDRCRRARAPARARCGLGVDGHALTQLDRTPCGARRRRARASRREVGEGKDDADEREPDDE